MNDDNNKEQSVNFNIKEDKFDVSITKDEINLFYKFISRVDLKGQEVPEFNKLINIFLPQNLKKSN